LLHGGKAFESAREGDTHSAEIRRLVEREVRNDGRTRESDLSVTLNDPGDLLPAPAMEAPRDGRSRTGAKCLLPGPSGPAGPGGKLRNAIPAIIRRSEHVDQGHDGSRCHRATRDRN
jgi:hypothetical protein